MKKKELLLMIVLGWINVAHAQQRRLDSILVLNNSYHQEDSLKAIYLREVFRAYSSVKNTAKVNLYIDSAILIASRLTRKSVLAGIYYRAGGVFHNSSKIRAITYYNKTIETARAANLPRTEAGGYLNLGALYMDVRDFSKSLDAHEHALQLFAQLNNEGGMSSCYMNMSDIYVNMGQHVKAIEYIRKALKVFEQDESRRGVAVAYNEIINLYFNSTDEELSAMGIQPANRFKEIAIALDKGLKAVLQTDDNSLTSNFYSKLGKLNEQQGNIAMARQNYMKAIDIIGDDMDEESYADNLILAGIFFINKVNEVPRGLGMLHAALVASRKQGSTGTEEEALIALSNAHEKQKNFDSSLFFYRKAIVVKDSIYSKEKEQEITRRQLKIDFDIKERDYRLAQQLTDGKLKQQEQEITLRNQQLQISGKEKTLQRLTFLQRQVELESQKKLQANQLKQEEQKARYDKSISDQQIKVQNVQLVSNRRLSLFLEVLAIIVFAIAVFIYNSRRKTVKLNKTVSEQKIALEELVTVKDKIFSIVSHDMRAPVNNIIAFSSLLEEVDIEQERLALYVNQIKGTLEHTSSLMENMLNWAASQMQGFTPVIESTDISQIVQHTIHGAEQSIRRKKIILNNKISGSNLVKGDRNMIELVMRNLLNNAVKFSNTGGTIELSVSKQGNKIMVSVSDNGVGMKEDKIVLINSTSKNSVQSTMGTGKEKGTGLGLMLCKHFVALMQGSIHVESTPGVGSVFSFILPEGG